MRRMDGPRHVAIGACVLPQTEAPSPKAQLDDNLQMIDTMAKLARERGWRLDVALLPEVSFKFATENVRAAAEDPDGPTVSAIGAKAREIGACATAPFLRRAGKHVYNSVALLDRGGRFVGAYDKVHPVMVADGSLEFGITPARRFPVFDLDFGRVGAQICWDVAYPEGWQALANQDAELVLFSTNPAVPLALRGYAWRHAYYIAASTVHPLAVIVDPIGRIVAKAERNREVVVARVNLDYRVLHSNCMWDWQLADHPEYQGKMSIEWDTDAHEYLASSLVPELPVQSFLDREGLESGARRSGRNTALQIQARGGPPVVPPPGQPQ